jgi:hypothetical protein
VDVGADATAVTNHLCALRFFYIQTLKRSWSIVDTPYPKKAHNLPRFSAKRKWRNSSMPLRLPFIARARDSLRDWRSPRPRRDGRSRGSPHHPCCPPRWKAQTIRTGHSAQRGFDRLQSTTLSRDRLLEEVWGYQNYPTTRTVDTHLVRLRQKLEPDPEQPQYFLTVHGTGYRFVG